MTIIIMIIIMMIIMIIMKIMRLLVLGLAFWLLLVLDDHRWYHYH